MIYDNDEYLLPYKREIDRRLERFLIKSGELAGYNGKLTHAANNHLYYGIHRDKNGYWFREFAPAAKGLVLVGDFNDWLPDKNYLAHTEWSFTNIGGGNWELFVPVEKIKEEDLFKWMVQFSTGEWGERIPAYATTCVQDRQTKLFSAQIDFSKREYEWKHKFSRKITSPLIYEVHIGMSSEQETVSTFNEFRENVLPRVIEDGYNVLQIMALQEHPYYGSFGYQVSNFFALSSRFGTPAEFKNLVDEAHAHGIAVVMDLVHSHAVKNDLEGLSTIDGSRDLYFHSGAAGDHPAWGTRCFNYGKEETIRFLLSNCKFWLQEYHLDGFRFDGITSMLYKDHGLERNFTGYNDYFTSNTDTDAYTYLSLANSLIKEIKPHAITIAEDMSGMPGLAAPVAEGGAGFDYRLAMGVPDHWIKWIKELPDECWNVGEMWYQLTNKRDDEKTISYAESHDQALVGDKTIIFRLLDSLMYTEMEKSSTDMRIDRGVALHKMIRLVTLATCGGGYLTFMGNEFGHPEWIDFPRQGNGWSYKYATRKWSLADNNLLRYSSLLQFEKNMIKLFKENDILKYRPVSIYNDVEKQIMAFKRGDYIFVFNFSPLKSYTDYTLYGIKDGDYRVVLDTDWKEFGGFERNNRDFKYKVSNGKFEIYVPSRCGLVYKM